MDEFSFIDSIKQPFYRQSSLIRGVGDDAAVYRQSSQDIVTAMDTFVENVHFTKGIMSASDIGYRVLAANLSDLAAMGAMPAFYLVSIVVPGNWSSADLQDIFRGMGRLAARFNVDLIGGDTVSGGELSITVTVIGYADQDKVRYRETAQDGDIVFVTGTLGDSAAGLHMLLQPGDYVDDRYFINRHINPEPRVAFARHLESINRVVLNDVSDGIANEAAEIAQASEVSVHIYPSLVPYHFALEQFRASVVNEWIFFGGEDFELLGAVSKEDWRLVQNAAEKTGSTVTKIGYVSNDDRFETGAVFLHEQDIIKRLEKDGYQHLK